MVCRESRLSSAMTTIARDMSGLEDNQCLGLNHALMQEGARSETPTPTQWNAFIDRVSADYNSGQLFVGATSRNPLRRLDAARHEPPDAARFYAAERIVTRSRNARNAHVEYLDRYARGVGAPGTHAATTFWTAFTEATDNARLQPTPAFVRAFTSNPDNANLPTDRRSLYAYEQMERAREDGTARLQTRPAVTRGAPPSPSSAIREMGYDPLNGRAEIVMNSNPGRVYAYRMSEDEWNAFVTAPSAGSYFARHIRGNPDYQYQSEEEANAAGVHRRCATCGQWSGAEHYCPITGSEEDLNRDVRLAVEAARARNPVTGTGAPATASLADVTRMPAGRTRNHPSENGVLRCAYPNRVRQEARRADQVLLPVRFGSSDGETVEGLALVTYNGRGVGYTATAVTEPGDSRADHLRCTCAEYRRTYRCPHLTHATTHLNDLLNPSDVPSVETITAAASIAAENLTRENAESRESVQAAARNWQPLSDSFTDNPERFQEIYEEFREKRSAYVAALENGESVEHPVPFIETEAFGGLASPGTGRRFGIEIEFEFPDDMSLEDRRIARTLIGRELRRERLTTTSQQQEYGAGHGWYREHHEEGWSYESDPTVNGGEIVSPAMADEPETWTNVKKVCEILQRHGAVASTHSGMHVNVGVADYNHTVANHNRLLTAYHENEDLLFRMSSNPDRGRHRGSGYSGPNHAPASPYTSIEQARNNNAGKHLALNMVSARGSQRDRVEFRSFDSTLTPGVMQAHIGMAIYMASAAGREGALPESPREQRPLGQRYEANPHRRALNGEEWNESTRGIREFLDTYVPGNGGEDTARERARQLIALFAMTKWQRGRRR